MGVLASKVTGRRYRLLAALARGGMGEVFVGEEIGPKAGTKPPQVAIKTLLPDIARDTTMLSRFLDEARISARLDHPNIARLLDFGEAAERPFAVFELLDGADLADCLDALVTRGQRMPVEVALALFIEACRGLHHAHTIEKDGTPLLVVHRDLSPSNLFLTRDGQVKVLDFGAAWGRDRITRTATGMIIGKLEYMSPEQVKGERFDARTDVFALGLCLHESLTLKRPYASANQQKQIELIFEAKVPSLELARPGLPPELYEVVKRATAAAPSGRFASARELGLALGPILAKLTRKDSRELLVRFHDDCFDEERHTRRAARLLELHARPAPSEDASFSWDAPPLREKPGVPEDAAEVEVLGVETRSMRAPEPDTDREPDPLRERGNENPTRPIPAPTTPATVSRRQPYLGYVIVGAVVLAALALGLLVGRLGATLGH